jgi:hypothetical protein
MRVDLLALARSLERNPFIAECPFPLLLAANELVAASSQELFSDEFVTISSMKQQQSPPPIQPATAEPVLYAVKKVHPQLPPGVLLGRTNECDIVVRDLSVSKTHALFLEKDGQWTLSDVGSRNGTHVKHVRAQPNGDAVPIAFGDIISFAFRTFYFLDAASAWDRVRAADRSRTRPERSDQTPV